MRAHTFTYILSFILLLCTPYWGGMEVHAQRAKKHREGILTTDSIRLKHQADSLALADTTDLQRQLNLKNLEAPVDTAALAQQNDSLQHAQPQPIEKNAGSPIPAVQYGWDWSSQGPDKSITGNTGSYPSFMEVLWAVPTPLPGTARCTRTIRRPIRTS